MVCGKCSTEIPENSIFCPACGQKIQEEEVMETQVLAEPLPVCAFCGEQLDAEAVFCHNCGKKQVEEKGPTIRKKAFALPKIKLSKRKFVVLVVAAGILAVVLIAGLCTNWFGFYGPATQIGLAVKNTVTAESFSMDFQFQQDKYRINTAELEGTVYASYDPKQEETILWITFPVDGQTIDLVVYDEELIVTNGDQYFHMETSAFTALFSEFLELGVSDTYPLTELVNTVFGGSTYEDVSQNLDSESLKTCMVALLQKLNDERWLEEYADYERKKTGGTVVHNFSIDPCEFLEESLLYLKDAFARRRTYKALMEGLADLEVASENTNCDLMINIQSGKLESVEADLSGSFEGLTKGDSIFFRGEFYDVGKTVLDMDELEEMQEKAIEFSF